RFVAGTSRANGAHMRSNPSWGGLRAVGRAYHLRRIAQKYTAVSEIEDVKPASAPAAALWVLVLVGPEFLAAEWFLRLGLGAAPDAATGDRSRLRHVRRVVARQLPLQLGLDLEAAVVVAVVGVGRDLLGGN